MTAMLYTVALTFQTEKLRHRLVSTGMAAVVVPVVMPMVVTAMINTAVGSPAIHKNTAQSYCPIQN